MSTFFDFTYNLNTQEAQNEVLYAIAASKKKEYEPISHFFTDASQLALPVSGNMGTDAFGPVLGSETTKYSTTSVVRASGSDPVKIFAICDGQVAILPQVDDLTKINIIIKPASSYAPIKIKYFIYRGVRKSDLIDTGNLIVEENTSDPNQPSFINKLRSRFVSFYLDVDSDIPPNFPASLIGFNPNQANDLLIDDLFTKRNSQDSYQMPNCSIGEHLGNFIGEVGLDIVLDYGDYRLTNQEELFKFNLEYGRKKQFMFDVATIPSSNSTKIKRYKEHIHQFIDPAAFWGSHIECGIIKLHDNASGIKTNTDIFNLIVSKYQTKNKIYAYIQGENTRSYNYYETTRKVFGFTTLGELNDTSGWPILIKEITLASATTTFKEGKNIQLEYDIASAIPELERQVTIDIISPNNVTSNYPLLTRPKNPSGTLPTVLIDKTPLSTILFPVNGIKSCATFLFIYAHLKQEIPLKNYYNQLWPVNINSNLSLPSNEINLSSWCTYDKSRMVNLDEVSDLGASIQNKVVFDNGRNQDAVGPNLPTKKRRLYMAVLKRNSVHDEEHDNLNIDTITAGLAKHIKTNEEYVLNLYNDKDFSIYKGTFTDAAETINSLTLFHEKSLTKKKSYFQLGITEEEYNKLIYDSITVPEIVPPETTVPQLLPVEADNVFFHLEEDITFVHDFIKKFKLGLRYEDNTGVITTLFPSSPINDIFVYTIDDFYFFSAEYSTFQQFAENYPKTKVDFRVKLPYAGEFGFDWIRDGLTGAPGDVNYKLNVGKLYSDSAHTIIEMNTNQDTGYFNVIPDEYKKLELEYISYPIQLTSLEKYFMPTMRLYPPYIASSFGTIDLDRQPIFSAPYDDTINRVASLQLKINNITNPIKLELDYDHTIFTIISGIIPTSIGSHTHDITVTCLKEFGQEQMIKVVAFYSSGVGAKGVTVGTLRVKPNVKVRRFSKKLLFVDIITNINGPTVPLIYSFDQHAKNLKKFLRQISTTPIVKAETINMVLSPDVIFDANYVFTNVATGVKYIIGFSEGTPLTPNDLITDYLYDKLKLQHQAGTTTPIGDIYKDYFKVFFFHDTGGYLDALGAYKGLSGFSDGSEKLVDYPNTYPSTTTHEFLHTADVQHTFTNIEGSSFAKHTFNPLKTDNILDYSDLLPVPHGFPTISLFEWQGEIAQKNFDPEP